MNHLKPGSTAQKWTHKEDELLMKLYSKYGSHWSIINKYFQNRNKHSLKNRFLFLERQNYIRKDMVNIIKNNVNGNATQKKKSKIKYNKNVKSEFNDEAPSINCSDEHKTADFNLLFEQIFKEKIFSPFDDDFDLF